MSDIAIRVEGLSKLYRLGAAERYHTLRDTLTDTFLAPFRRLGRGASNREEAERLWALKDVSFEVKHGEVIGIIGRNGAGKSTLLKILSRITEPTHGRAEIRGRVGSLLEVGTGFHPELSGRENIFLNGAILGMKKAEISRKFDEIAAFAEVERFIDTPVKHYSSGMYVRLAFAVAAYLEPDILLIDEVLAVGDFAFQEKCLGRIGNLATEGRTVLFVSHNIAAVVNLCSRAYLFSSGRIAALGTPEQVVTEYVRLASPGNVVPLLDRHDRKGDGRVRFTRMEVSQGDTVTSSVVSGQDLEIYLYYECPDGTRVNNVVFSIAIYTIYGQVLVYLANDMIGKHFDQTPIRGIAVCKIPCLPFSAGLYDINVNCDANGELADWIPRATRLSVVEGDFFGTGRLPPATHGGLLTKHEWELIEV